MATHSSKVAHKTGPHHLSQQSLLKDGGASDGWVESLTSLTESVQATQLLDEEAAHAAARLVLAPCVGHSVEQRSGCCDGKAENLHGCEVWDPCAGQQNAKAQFLKWRSG